MIGLIGAMDVEVRDLISHLENKKEVNILNLHFYTGKFGKNAVVILKCGVGKVQSAIGCALMIENFHPSVIINTGIAGGTNGLKQYDVVLGKDVRYSDVNATGFGYKLGQVPGMPESYKPDNMYLESVAAILDELNIKYVRGNILSGDSFITSYDQLMIKPIEATAVEMEGASIAQTCFINDTKFVSIRFISDVVGGSDQSDAYNKFEEEAAKESATICYKVASTL
ncbi:MAG: 5'-methylthioadenosine/adenosylhomocysteine nucleosidase [Acholeplasmatales bacterium]|nr:5'-methylthioadenosine/adenosylhomocysteine nucleosidase [Acholeplasmatales bacterium]